MGDMETNIVCAEFLGLSVRGSGWAPFSFFVFAPLAVAFPGGDRVCSGRMPTDAFRCQLRMP